MLKMSEASYQFLKKYLPHVLEAEKCNDILLPLYDLINEKGFAPPHNNDYNAFGREAQKVYDDVYYNNE